VNFDQIPTWGYLLCIIVQGIWIGVTSLTSRGNKAEDARQERETSMVMELQRETSDIRVQLATLKTQIENMPSHGALAAQFREMEDRLEKRLENVVKRLEEAVASGVAKFKCSHDDQRG